MIKNCFLFVLFLACHFSLAAQEKGFYSVYADPEGKYWSPFDVVETNSGDYWVSVSNYTGTESKLFSISPEGVFSEGIVVEEEGMRVFVTRLFELQDGSGDIVALGTCQSVTNEPSALLCLHLDSEMNEVRRRIVPFSFEEEMVKDIKFMEKEDGFFAAVTFGQQFPLNIYLVEISDEGEIINHARCEMDSLMTVCDLFPIQGGANQFGMFAHTSGSSHASMGILVFDNDLSLISRSYFPQWDCGWNNMYLYDHGNGCIMPFQDDGFLLSSRLREFSVTHDDMSSIFAKFDNDFTMQSYTIIGHMNDTIDCPAFYNSVDYYVHSDNSSIYQCTMQNINYDWPLQFAPMHIVVTKADADLNIEWQKRFLTDGIAYTPFTMTASSDGGCLIIGEAFDYVHNQQWNLFALKINADGMVGVDEIREESLAFVYPNPANGTLNIGGVEAKETQVYNVNGQCVKTFKGNMANIEDLAKGCYVLSIVDTEGKVQTQRLVVEK